MPSAAPRARLASGDCSEFPFPSLDEAQHEDVALKEMLKIVVEGQIKRSLTQHHEVLLSQIRLLIALVKEGDCQELKDKSPRATKFSDHLALQDLSPRTSQFSDRPSGTRQSYFETIRESSCEEVEENSHDKRSTERNRGSSAEAIAQSNRGRSSISVYGRVQFITRTFSNLNNPKTKSGKIVEYVENIERMSTNKVEQSSVVLQKGASSAAVMAQLAKDALGPQNRLQSFLSSSLFEVSMGLIVLANAAFVGCEVNYLATNPNEASVPAYFKIISLCFTCIFVSELLLRLLGDCFGFLCESDMGQFMWNYLDIFIVLSSLVEVAVDFASNTSAGGGGVSVTNIQTIHVIRVFRLLRLIRLARFVRFIRALRLMVVSILHTLTHVFGAMILLTVIMYIFAILFTSATTAYKTTRLINEDAPVIPDLEERWGSIDLSMLSLFMSISAGISWVEIIEPLKRLNTTWVYCFLVYVSFTYFAVLNVVTGVFCQAALQSSNEDQDAMLQTFLRHQKIYTERFKYLFKSIDADDSGVITIWEFLDKMYDEDVCNYFASLDLESNDALCLFDLLESSAEGVEIEEFVMGCLRLKGSARSSDMLKLLHEHRLLSEQLEKLTDHFGLTESRATRLATRSHGLLGNDLLNV